MHKDLLSFSVEQLLDSFIIPVKENAFKKNSGFTYQLIRLDDK
ncbi:hypothetical protein HMPREF1351_01826 [Enterococcus faecium 510]|uniref:Transposase n=1 Tax=Enterococcus faecium (strain ATCC BAA-472 / TX0016 / DO) TaxID=333849 RepID=I3U227_ENTFD|nr:hypothetical protein HMPREF0351_11441 [Enterococcus faecium DO]EJY38068.1 hypothetical protein HMPREF1351_01826 [Enterococcus faecium 510]